MEFRVLGSLEVVDGTRLVDLPGGRARALLTLLCLHAGEVVSAERLIDELWGESPPPTAATALQGAVSRLRSALEPGRKKGEPGSVVQTTAKGYRLAVDADAVDAHRFKRLLDAAANADPQRRAQALSTALGLWRGPALADFAYEPFAQATISVLEELRVQAAEDRAEADLGRPDVITELEELARDHPYRERVHGLLMLALYRSGRQSEALEVYRAARERLVEEMGIEPGPALRDLESAILRQDPSLESLPRRERVDAQTGSWLPRERRTVTVAVVDVAPSAPPDADAEAVAALTARAAGVARDALERHGARVERAIGDEMLAFFGFPSAHEDDAVRAVRAALEVRNALGQSRVGIETGDIVVEGPGAGPSDVGGPVISSAARLQRTAAQGDVLLGPIAQSLTRGAVIVEPVRASDAWRVRNVVSSSHGGELEAPMIGRQPQLARLRSAFRRAANSRTAVATTILGEAGIGKSRLVRELAASLGAAAHVITERCTGYGEGLGFVPIRDAITEGAGIYGWRRLHRLFVGDDGGTFPSEIGDAFELRPDPANVTVLFPAVRRLFEVLAADHALIVVFEDLHWGEATTLELVDDLADRATGPLLVLRVARPDVLEQRPAWDDGVWLDPLTSEELETLVAERGGRTTPGQKRKIMDLSGGNPLFAEQLIATLQDASRVDSVPASLQGLLTMRLDRLGPGERDVLRCASIVGDEATADAVAALLPEGAHPFIGRHIDALQRKRLIARSGDDSFRFVHVLVELAAYESMTRRDRAVLHQRYSDWLERNSVEPGDIVGRHRERAAAHRRLSGATE